MCVRPRSRKEDPIGMALELCYDQKETLKVTGRGGCPSIFKPKNARERKMLVYETCGKTAASLVPVKWGSNVTSFEHRTT